MASNVSLELAALRQEVAANSVLLLEVLEAVTVPAAVVELEGAPGEALPPALDEPKGTGE